MAAMELGLAHSLSRYKLKFSPDKVDTMIVQVSSLSSAAVLLTVLTSVRQFGHNILPFTYGRASFGV